MSWPILETWFYGRIDDKKNWFWNFPTFKDVLEASNVKECTLIKKGCANYPCINGGECKPLSKNDYECVCGQKFR